MRRALLLLAVLVAGFEGEARATVSPGSPVEIAARDASLGPTALLRAAAPLLVAPWHDGSGPSPRPVGRRAAELELRSLPALSHAGREAAFQAQESAHREYAAHLSLMRSGLQSFRTTAPPPFRLV